MDYYDDDIYINEGSVPGDKPKISDKKRNELLKIGEDSICKISIPDVNHGNGFFCKINYNGNKYNVLIIKKKIIKEESLKKINHLKIKYKDNPSIDILIKNKILNINCGNKKK